MYFLVVNSFGQETKKFYERLEIGTDISSIFEEDLAGFPGSLIFRLYHNYKPIAYRLSIYDDSMVKYKRAVEDVTTSKYNRYNTSLAVGVDWFFLNKELYQMYLGNEIGGSYYYNKTPSLDNEGNAIEGEKTYSKNYGISDYFNFGIKIKVLKKLSLGVESKLSLGINSYQTGEETSGNSSTKTKDTNSYIEFDSFSSLTLLYHF